LGPLLGLLRFRRRHIQLIRWDSAIFIGRTILEQQISIHVNPTPDHIDVTEDPNQFDIGQACTLTSPKTKQTTHIRVSFLFIVININGVVVSVFITIAIASRKKKNSDTIENNFVRIQHPCRPKKYGRHFILADPRKQEYHLTNQAMDIITFS
jgi:hypothetical protein